MNFLDTLDCPQYFNFESLMFAGNRGLESTPSSSSVKNDDMGPKSIDTNECESYVDNSSCQEDASCDMESKSMHANESESYVDNSSCQEDARSTVSNETDDFPTHFPKKLPGKDPKMKPKMITKVKPFHFAEGKKRKRDENEREEHIPLAEQIVAFHKKTPERFHSTRQKEFEPTDHWSPVRVIPQSPKLRAAKRQRTVNAISREEQEEKEAEEMKRYKFRARPVNKNILKRQSLSGMGKKARTPTRPHSMYLRTAQRAIEAKGKEKEDDKGYEFHARPVPKAILNGPVGLKEKPSIPVTQPKTPNFHLKSRAEKWKSQSKLNDTTLENPGFKALPLPAASAPFVVKHEKKLTAIQPFSFESRDKERMAHKEEKIKQEIAKESAVYVFKAQPIPYSSPCSLPPVEKKPLTVPKPFNFHMEGRSSKHNSFDVSMDYPVFKAQPAKVLDKPPFVPEKSGKHTVDVKEFNLHTDVRAVERQKLKEINDIKEHEKELALQRLKQVQEEEERREIAKLRKETVHKANPIRQFKPLEIKGSDKPVTEPKSPKFKTDERLQIRHQIM